jgi:putative aminopeptidase FrvX
MIAFDALFALIHRLVMCHSPSGQEVEIDQMLMQHLQSLGRETWQDAAGNIICRIPGLDSSRAIAITAHKDEIGGIVKAVEANGRLSVRRLGGAFPWVYGEGVVDVLGDHQTLSGILSFGSRHVSHESPQKVFQDDTPLRWEDVWIETKCTPEELAVAGVRPGTRVVIGKHRKTPFRLRDYIASYTLDNKASLAILLTLAELVQQPMVDVYLVASAKEEVGAIGALYFTQHFSQHLTQRVTQYLTQPRNWFIDGSSIEDMVRQLTERMSDLTGRSPHLDALIALEICPLSTEYPIQDGDVPVLLSQDGYGLYDERLNQELLRAGAHVNIAMQQAAISGFGSDGSIAMKNGHVGRAACLGFPTQNTHGYEIAHLGAIAHCITVLRTYCEQPG